MAVRNSGMTRKMRQSIIRVNNDKLLTEKYMSAARRATKFIVQEMVGTLINR